MNKSIQEKLLAILACFLWSTAFAGIKIGIEYTTPIQFAGVRFMLAGLITLLAMGKYQQNFRDLFENRKVVLKVAFLQTALVYFLFYSGLDRISGALGAVITGFGPLWGIILAHFFMNNDKITIRKLVAFAMGLAGIVVVALGRGKGVGEVDLPGILLMMGSSLSSGFAAILVAKDKGSLKPIPLNGMQLFVGGTILFIISLFTEGFAVPTSTRYCGSLLYLALLSASAFSIWFKLLKNGAKISALNIWKFIIPVSGAVVSWILLPNESPTLLAIAGMLLVGMALIFYYKGVEKK